MSNPNMCAFALECKFKKQLIFTLNSLTLICIYNWECVFVCGCACMRVHACVWVIGKWKACAWQDRVPISANRCLCFFQPSHLLPTSTMHPSSYCYVILVLIQVFLDTMTCFLLTNQSSEWQRKVYNVNCIENKKCIPFSYPRNS